MILEFIKRNWMPLLITIVWVILTSLSKLEIHFEWFLNVNVWVNTIILYLFIYNIMSLITLKIKNRYWQNFINLTCTLFIGETIKYNFNILNLSAINIISIILFAVVVVYFSYMSFCLGVNKAQREENVIKAKLKRDVCSMTKEEYKIFKKEIKRSINFLRKYGFASSLIKGTESIEDLENSIKTYDELRSNK